MFSSFFKHSPLLFFVSLIAIFSLSVNAQTTYTETVCQTVSMATIGQDRNLFAHNNNAVNEGYLHDFQAINVPTPCGDPTLTGLVLTLDLTGITDNTDGSTCNYVGVYGNILVDCGGICNINQSINGGCNNFNTPITNTDFYSINLLNCPGNPPPNANSVIFFDIIPAMDFTNFPGCPNNTNAITSGTVTLDYEICIEYTFSVPEFPVPSVGGSGPHCSGEDIFLTADGGNSYEWSGPDGFSSNDQNPVIPNVTNLQSGNYSVTVTGAPGCEAAGSVFVEVYEEITITVDDIMEPTCNGLANGSATLSASGGSGSGYSYDWSPGGFTSNTANGLSGDVTYNVMVEDGFGCLGTLDITLDQPDPIEVNLNFSTDPSCNGINDGSAEFFATGGDGAYTFSWTPGSFSTPSENTLSGGVTYTILVEDGNNCTGTTTLLLDNPAPITNSFINIVQPNCAGSPTGSALADGMGGTGSLLYEWSNGNLTQNPGNLLGDSTYFVTITDANNCTLVDSITLQNPPPISMSFINISNPDCGASNGSATAVVAGGNGTFTYQWQPGNFTGQTVSTLEGGVLYTVIATDASGCTAQQTLSLNEAASFEADLTSQEAPQCFGQPNGSAAFTPQDPGVYTYLWSNGVTDSLATNLIGDSTYFITITDANDCKFIDTVRLNQPQAILANLSVIQNPSCFGARDGSIQNMVAGGTGSYTINWSSNLSHDTIISSLAAGTYFLTITDGQNCTARDSIILTAPPPISVEINGDSTLCLATQGNLLVAANYASYLWSTSDTSQSIAINGPGTYSVLITDSLGCQGVDTFMVQALPVPDASISGSSTFCVGGSTTLSALSGYTSYLWSNGSTDSVITVTSPATYVVEVTNSDGCLARDSLVVSETTSLSPNITGIPAFCAGSSTTLNAGAGYSGYSWSTSAVSQTISVSLPGTYFVTVTDNSGCTGIDSIIVQENSLPVFSISGDTSFCIGSSTTLTADPGFNSYTWNGVTGGNSFQANVQGLVTAVITDANGCQNSQSINLTENPNPVFSISGPTGICTGDTAVLSGPINFQSYSWSNGSNTFETSANIPGNYILTVTDLNGCSGRDTFSLGTLPSPVPMILGTNAFCTGDSAALSADQSYISYEWSTGQTASSIFVQVAGNYSLTVINSQGCRGATSIQVTENQLPDFQIGGATSFCIGNFTTLSVPAGFASYLWSNNTSGSSITVSQAGNYAVTVTDANGCQNSKSVSVQVLPGLSPQITGARPFCPGDSILLLADQSYTSYLWSNSQTSSQIWVTQGGTYILTVADQAGCSGSDTIQLSTFPVPQPTSLQFNICQGESVQVGTSNYTQSGNYADTLMTVNGCDSIIRTQLTVQQVYSLNLQDTICQGDSIFLGGAWQSGSGIYMDTLQAVTGCDSIVLTDLFVSSCAPQITLQAIDISCNGGQDGQITLTLQTGNPPYTVRWTNQSNNETGTANLILPNNPVLLGSLSAGTYEIVVTDRFGNVISTLFSDVLEPAPISSSTTIDKELACFDSQDGVISISSQGGTPGYNYLWNDGTTSSTNFGLGAGIYTILVEDANECLDSVSVTLTAPESINAEVETESVSCANNSDGRLQVINITGGTPNYSISFNNGAFGPVTQFDNLGIGNYQLAIQDANGCILEIRNVQVDGPPQLGISLPGEITINLGDSTSLSPNYNFNPTEIVWSPSESLNCSDCLYPIAKPNENTLYTVKAYVSDSCFAEASVNVKVISTKKVFIPSAFSPNGDGINDVFFPNTGGDAARILTLAIFDRWGNLIFMNENGQPNDPGFGWDGRYKSKFMDTGVFVYMVKVEFFDGSIEVLSGDLLLLAN